MSAISLRKAVFSSMLFGAVLVSGCTPIETTHGYIPIEANLEGIVIAQDTKDTVLQRLGEPTGKGVQGDSAWYYVSYTERRLAFLAPQITRREILAVSFGASGVVTSVDRYGLENGVVVDLNSRETVTGGRRLTLLQQFIGNIGNFSAESFL